MLVFLSSERKPYQQQPQVKPDKTSTALQVISVLLCIGGTAFLVVGETRLATEVTRTLFP